MHAVGVSTETVTGVADELLARVILDPDVRRDPFPLLHQLREEAPVFRSVMGPVVVSTYEAGQAVLRDARLGRGVAARLRGELPVSGGPLGFGFPVAGDGAAALFERAGTSMLFADPPEHTRLRRLVSAAFTAHRVEALREIVEATVGDLVGRIDATGVVDVIETVARPLPIAVIGDLVGVPRPDRAGFAVIVDRAVAALDPFATPAAIQAGIDAYDEMAGYFSHLVTERRRRPTPDLLSALVAARDSGDALDDTEVVSTATLLFAAGFETTTNLIGNGLLALLRNPTELQRLRRDRGLLDSAVEELIRWDSPVPMNGRTALAEAEVAGERVAPGDFVLVMTAAANRDPTRFRAPDTLDIGRTDGPALSFGWGIHHCLGAPLARMETRLVLGALLDRFRTIELAVDEPPRRPTLAVRGLAALPVHVTE